MRSEQEIRQAIADLTEALPYNIRAEGIEGPSVRLNKAVLDTLNYVVGNPSVCEKALPVLRSLTAQRKAGTN